MSSSDDCLRSGHAHGLLLSRVGLELEQSRLVKRPSLDEADTSAATRWKAVRPAAS